MNNKSAIKKLFTNCDIYTGNEILTHHCVLTEGDKIISVLDENTQIENVEIIDLKGLTLAPAFIDIQINGGGGSFFTDEQNLESLKIISHAHEKFGTLNFCPTIISTDIKIMYECLKFVRSAQKLNIGIIGAHIEGPFIEETKAGIHNKNYIHSAQIHEINELLSLFADTIKIITVAPENFDINFVDEFVRKNIKVFIGHTNATANQAKKYFDRGCTGVTHLFNAMSQLNSREIGVVGASFINKKSWAGIIADGYHVDYEALKIAKTFKHDKLFLVTDAMPPVGKSNDYKFKFGERDIICNNGKCTTLGKILAGSALNMAQAVRNLVQKCGIAKDEALRMASTYPAQMLNNDKFGYIREGAVADFVILNGQIYVDAIVRHGKYKKI